MDIENINKNMKQTTAVLFVSHILDDEIAFRYNLLKDACIKLGYDLFFAIDISNNYPEFTKFKDAGINFYPFSYSEYEYRFLDMAFILDDKDQRQKTYHNTPFDVYHLFVNEYKQKYQKIWIVENDVFCSGDWYQFFAKYDNNDADLLCMSCTYTDNMTVAKGQWWVLKQLTDSLKSADYKKCLSWSLMCLSRIDVKLHALMLDFFKTMASNGYDMHKFHQELAFPTVAKMNGLKIDVFNACNLLDGGTILRENNCMIYHPVKDVQGCSFKDLLNNISVQFSSALSYMPSASIQYQRSNASQSSSNTSTVALVIIYNNNFEQNIEKIEKIYKNRFNVLFHLMPGYNVKQHKENGTYHDNVLPVYYDSKNFNGYIPQVKDVLLATNCDYYAFIADDVLLDPVLNQDNLIDALSLSKYAKDDNSQKTGYINEMYIIDNAELIEYVYGMQSICYISSETYSYKHNYIKLLPSYDDACKRFLMHGLDPQQMCGTGFLTFLQNNFARFLNWQNYIDLKTLYLNIDQYTKNQLHFIADNCNKNDVNRCYPAVHAFSDFFVVSRAAFEEFAYLCGVFAIIGIFVEAAIPTAMILCLDNISKFKDTCYLKFDDGIYPHGRQKYPAMYKNDFMKLVQNEFSTQNKQLFIHPVKLQQFDNINIASD